MQETGEKWKERMEGKKEGGSKDCWREGGRGREREGGREGKRMEYRLEGRKEENGEGGRKGKKEWRKERRI